MRVPRLDKQTHDIRVDEDSDSDRDDIGISRSKRLKKIDVNNPLSAFQVKTKTKIAHIQASSFCKQTWNEIRGMDGVTGKFLTEDRPNPDDWQKMAKSDKIVKKWSGDPAFADTRLDDGLASVVPKNVSKEESQLLNTQKAMGALGHMVLSATEGYNSLYKKTSEFILSIIGELNETNPDYDSSGGTDVSIPKFVFSDLQNRQYDELNALLREWQVDVSEPLAGAARTAAAYHIKILASRREKVISKVRSNNSRAATAVSKIPPSASGMFGGDNAELEKVVKLAGHLSSGTAKHSFQGSSSSSFPAQNSFRGKQRRGSYGSGASARGGYQGFKSDSKFSERKSGNKDSERGGRRGNYRGRGH